MTECQLNGNFLPLEDGFLIAKEDGIKSPVYSLFKFGQSIETYDCLKTALAAYKALRRHRLTGNEYTLRRLKSYRDEWQAPGERH